jgi:hypothetical protein
VRQGEETQNEAETIERHEASQVIQADAAAIFAVVSSPSGHVAMDATDQGVTAASAFTMPSP